MIALVSVVIGSKLKHRRYYAVFAVVFALLVVAQFAVMDDKTGSPGLIGLP